MAKRKKDHVLLDRPDRVLFPETEFRKSHAARYYAEIAPLLLPHVAGRPMSFRRYPDTIDREAFWEKDAPSFTPEWVETFPVPRRGGGRAIDYVVVNDAKTLLWLVDVGMVELHPFLHRVPVIDRALSVVFDLDPGAGASIVDCARVAALLRAWLAERELEALPKVSGSKGIQLYLPLNGDGTPHDVTETFATLVAQEMARAHPGLIVAKMQKSLRAKKVFIDASQNAGFKTTVSVYSLRAKRDEPYVSMPVSWSELARAVSKGNPASLEFDPPSALRRADRMGDLFAPALELEQKLPEAFVDAVARLPKAKRKRSEEEEAESAVSGVLLPKRASQSGRRLFVLVKGERGNELWLEQTGKFRRFILREDRRGEGRLIAMPAGTFRADPAWFRGEVQEEYRGRVEIEEIGSWEVIEGSFEREELAVWFSGRALRGEWRLAKIEPGRRHRSWELAPG